ncbi:MAG: carbonic anhydrase family protein [Opitutales bacterium]
MKKRLLTTAALIVGACSLTGAMEPGHTDAGLPTTPEQQAELTPTAVLAQLKAGNARFVEGTYKTPDIPESIEAAQAGQFPKAYILSCVDSRVPVELVFNQGIGDIFVGRVAGNAENEDQLGSMEFAAAVAGVKLIVVLGHEACGAVKGACDGVELGNLTMLLEKLAPAVRAVEGYESERTSKNAAFVTEVVHTNVERTVADIRSRSEVLRGLEDAGDLMIVGAYYSLQDGSVTFK